MASVNPNLYIDPTGLNQPLPEYDQLQSQDEPSLPSPIQNLNNNHDIVNIPQPNNYNYARARITDIDFYLENEFQCYQFFVWFTFTSSLIFLMMSIIELFDPIFKKYIFLIVFNTIYFAISVVGNYCGLIALRIKSEKRQQVFKYILVTIILYNIARIAHLQFGGFIGFLLNLFVYSNAIRIDKLLQERKQLLNEDIEL